MLSFAAVASERYLAYEETKTHKRRKPGHRNLFLFLSLAPRRFMH